MQSKQSDDLDKIDHVADQLDDIKITVDELADSQRGAGSEPVARLQQSIERAIDAVDELEDLDS